MGTWAVKHAMASFRMPVIVIFMPVSAKADWQAMLMQIISRWLADVSSHRIGHAQLAVTPSRRPMARPSVHRPGIEAWHLMASTNKCRHQKERSQRAVIFRRHALAAGELPPCVPPSHHFEAMLVVIRSLAREHAEHDVNIVKPPRYQSHLRLNWPSGYTRRSAALKS